MRLKPSVFALSGTKDRRAITVQRVSAFRVPRHRLADGPARRLPGIWLSDFRYAPAPLKMGDTAGNRFSVILRDLDPSVDESSLRSRVDQWRHLGFLNYFGPQRFGSCGIDTAHIGHLMLSGRWEAATRALLAPRLEARDSLNKCLAHYAESGDAAEALRMLEEAEKGAGAGANIERTLLVRLSKNGNDHKGAVMALSRDMRTMYIHAYQSLVFNKIITRRKQRFGLSVVAGDLDADGNVLTGDDDIPIDRVCLPLPSLAGTKMPQNEVGQWYDEIAAQDGVQQDQFAKLGKQFALGSVYRPFLVCPANVIWELIRYSDDTEQLQKCEFVPSPKNAKMEAEKAEHQKKGFGPKRALKVQFDLPPGTYATVALRELMRTDFSKQAQKAMEEERKRVTEKRKMEEEEDEREEKGPERKKMMMDEEEEEERKMEDEDEVEEGKKRKNDDEKGEEEGG